MHIRRALKRSAAICVALCVLSFQLPAGQRLRLRWGELAPLIGGKRVSIGLKSSGQVTGTVRGVNETSLKLDLIRSSEPKVYPKGLVDIPRSSISNIDVHRRGGHKGLIIGGAVGGGVSALAGGILGAQTANEGGIAAGGVMAAAIVAPIAFGLLIGQLFDLLAHGSQKQITVADE